MPVPAAARQPDPPGARWFASSAAQRLMREEQRRTLPMLASCYGQVGVYLRGDALLPAVLPGSMVQSLVHGHRTAGGWQGDLAFSDEAWPLQRESVELVYLLHVLEVVPDAGALLAEAARVLVPDGALIAVALAPWSPWRLRWAGCGLRSVGASRARDWLTRTGFETLQQIGVGPVLPRMPAAVSVSGPDSVLHEVAAPLQAGYALLARKRRAGLTPLRPRPAAVTFAPGVGPG